MLLTHSFYKDQAQKELEATRAHASGKDVSQLKSELRLNRINKIAEIEISNSRLERLIEAPIIRYHKADEDSDPNRDAIRAIEVLVDVDSTAARRNATHFQMKVICERLNIKPDVMKHEFEKLGEARAKFSNVLLNTTKIHENNRIRTWRRAKTSLNRALQDFYSTIFNDKSKEDVLDAIEDYAVEIIKYPTRYFDPRILDLPVALSKVGINAKIATQNLLEFIAPVVSPLNYTDLIGNRIPASQGDRIIFPTSSIPLTIISAADKSEAARRMESQICRVYDVNTDELYDADFFSKEEVDSFKPGVRSKKHEAPLVGSYRRSYMVESTGEFWGDALQSTHGKPGKSNFHGVFLLKNEETEFSESGPLGHAARQMFERGGTRIIEIEKPDEVSNYIINTTIHFLQTVGAMGLEDYIKQLESGRNLDDLTYVDRDRLSNVIEEHKKELYKTKWIIQELKKSGISINESDVIGGKKPGIYYKMRLPPTRISDTKIKAEFMKGIRGEIFDSVRRHSGFLSDSERAYAEEPIDYFRGINERISRLNDMQKREIFNSEIYQ